MTVNAMEQRNANTTPNTNGVVLIANSRLIMISFIMFVFGAFGGILGIATLLNHLQFETMAIIFSVFAILGSVYALYFGVKCQLITRVQLEFKPDGISYRDIRKHIMARNPQGLGLGFYINTKFYFLSYSSIEKVTLENIGVWCKVIRIDTKLKEVIYLPILLESCKEIEELANLIDKKRQ